MKAIIKSLERQKEKLRILTKKREASFNKKSEKWQESEKGALFEVVTNNIDYRADELASFIDGLKELM